MAIDWRYIASMATGLLSSVVFAHDMNRSDDMTDVFHAFRLQFDAGTGRNDTVSRYDLDGWIGGDNNKLWVHAVGEQVDGSTRHDETWLLYSRNVDTFWDLQLGVRHDDSPRAISYAVFGINGLAPYAFETELHLFASETGDTSVRLHERRDFLLTQRWLLQPYAELDWSAQDVVQQQVGHGVSGGEFGIQLRYEITRQFAPYVDLRYQRAVGRTAQLLDADGETDEDVILAAGLWCLF